MNKFNQCKTVFELLNTPIVLSIIDNFIQNESIGGSLTDSSLEAKLALILWDKWYKKLFLDKFLSEIQKNIKWGVSDLGITEQNIIDFLNSFEVLAKNISFSITKNIERDIRAQIFDKIMNIFRMKLDSLESISVKEEVKENKLLAEIILSGYSLRDEKREKVRKILGKNIFFLGKEYILVQTDEGIEAFDREWKELVVEGKECKIVKFWNEFLIVLTLDNTVLKSNGEKWKDSEWREIKKYIWKYILWWDEYHEVKIGIKKCFINNSGEVLKTKKGKVVREITTFRKILFIDEVEEKISEREKWYVRYFDIEGEKYISVRVWFKNTIINKKGEILSIGNMDVRRISMVYYNGNVYFKIWIGENYPHEKILSLNVKTRRLEAFRRWLEDSNIPWTTALWIWERLLTLPFSLLREDLLRIFWLEIDLDIFSIELIRNKKWIAVGYKLVKKVKEWNKNIS